MSSAMSFVIVSYILTVERPKTAWSMVEAFRDGTERAALDE